MSAWVHVERRVRFLGTVRRTFEPFVPFEPFEWIEGRRGRRFAFGDQAVAEDLPELFIVIRRDLAGERGPHA